MITHYLVLQYLVVYLNEGGKRRATCCEHALLQLNHYILLEKVEVFRSSRFIQHHNIILRKVVKHTSVLMDDFTLTCSSHVQVAVQGPVQGPVQVDVLKIIYLLLTILLRVSVSCVFILVRFA